MVFSFAKSNLFYMIFLFFSIETKTIVAFFSIFLQKRIRCVTIKTSNKENSL